MIVPIKMKAGPRVLFVPKCSAPIPLRPAPRKAPPGAMLRFNSKNSWGEIAHISAAMQLDCSLRVQVSKGKNAVRADTYFCSQFCRQRVVISTDRNRSKTLSGSELAATGTIIHALTVNPSWAISRMRSGLVGEAMPTQISKLLNCKLGGRRPLVLVWNRNSTYQPCRNSTVDHLYSVVNSVIEAGFQPVMLGNSLSEGFDSSHVINLTNHWEVSILRERQDELLFFECLKLAGAVAQVGMRSGGMDALAFHGLPTISVDEFAPTDRMGHLVGKLPYFVEARTDEAIKLIAQLAAKPCDLPLIQSIQPNVVNRPSSNDSPVSETSS